MPKFGMLTAALWVKNLPKPIHINVNIWMDMDARI